MLPAMCRRQPFLTSMFVPLLQLTQGSESQRVSLRGFCSQSLERVKPIAGAHATSFPNTVVRGVQPTLSTVGTVPSEHLAHVKPALPFWVARPAGQVRHVRESASKYCVLSQALQALRCLLATVPFAHAAQRLPLGDTVTPLQATLHTPVGE